ncbi:MAG: DUF1007 family protein [Spirochaetes bacterium]|jgi:ABC-type uncharacterized transport system substrate-binding protein|nr:DUF1007 family protein [Spirochaetota bacterium]
MVNLIKKTFLLIILVSSTLYSHPHLFIKPTLELVISDNKIEGLKVSWEWDRWWSAEVVSECDLDKSGSFDDKEIKMIYEEFFSAIKNFNYFTDLYINSKKIKISLVSGFSASIGKDNIVTYVFTIPISHVATSGAKVKVNFNDETIYTAFDRSIKLKPNSLYIFNNYKVAESGYYGAEVTFEIKSK